MKSKRHHPPGRQVKILAAVRISKASGRDMLSGMFRFIEQNPSWQLHLVQYGSDFTADAVRRAPDEGFDGIVVTFPGAKGQSFKAGFYGGPNSSARRKMANFGDGTGILMVGDVGFMMNVR